MIGIAKYNLSLNVVAEFVHVHTLDGTRSAYGHENRGFDIPVIGRYNAGTSLTAGCRMLQSEFRNRLQS